MKPAFALLFALFVDLMPLTGADSTTTRTPPNVLFIAVDDLNGWAMGGHPDAQTPHLERLASRGTSFTNAHCAAPACNPSRVSVLTGIRPSTSGVYLNAQDWRDCANLRDAVTLPQYFKNQGYRTLGGGKIYHAASLSEIGHRGLIDAEPWDDYFPSKQRQLPVEVKPPIFPANGSRKFYKGYFDWAPLDISDDQMGDAQVVRWAEDQLSRPSERPLFLAVGIYRPHIPWYVPKSYFERYSVGEFRMPRTRAGDLDDVPAAGQAMARRHWHQWMRDEEKWEEAVRAYLASMTFADAMVGRLIDALDDGPLADNTIVVLWSDHGYHLGHKEHWEKFALWEQTTRVPLIIASPGQPKGAQCDRPVSLIDIYPTLIELCGAKPQPGLEGKSLVPWLENAQRDSNRAVVTTQGFNNHAIRSQDWRFIQYADGSTELYDHRNDPNEFTNLANQPEFETVIRSHRRWLPAHNAKQEPLKTGWNRARVND